MDDRIRISDADRDQVAARLREHFAQGRLTADELDERLATTLSAKTFGEVRPVMADLPGEHLVAPAPSTASARPGGPPPWAWRRGPRFFPVALLILAALIVTHGGAIIFLAAFLAVAAVRNARRRAHRN